MAKRKKVVTPTQQAYKKQRARIQQFIRRAEKRGYQFKENTLPKIPKRITKASVSRLEALTPEKLYEKAVYGGKATFGEIVTGKEGRKAEKSARSRKAAQTRKYRLGKPSQEPTNTPGFEPPENISTDGTLYDKIVISNWYGALNAFSNGRAYGLLKAWLENIIAQNGQHNTAIMLEEGSSAGYILTFEIVYKPEEAYSYIGYMLDYLPDQGILYKDEVMDSMQYMSALCDALEQEETWEEPE